MATVLGVFLLGGLFTMLAACLLIAERVLTRYGTSKIDINAGERIFEIEGGQSLLSTLYGQEIFIPSACGGRSACGYCKVTLLEGGGPVLPTEQMSLTSREIRSGTRLACQVKVREDIRLRIPEELLNVRLFTATVESTRYLTDDTKEVGLSLVDPPEISHVPGQYIQVQIPSAGEAVFRAYSVSSPVYEPRVVDLVVRLVPGGIGSTYIHNLKVSDSVTFTGPFGEFRLNEDPSVEVVCVAGGCGMAPVKNIIYSLYNRWPERPCSLFFGCRTTKDIFYLDEYQALARKHPAFKMIYALSTSLSSDEVWDGETGFIHLAVDKHLEPGVRRQAFLCGPPPMVEAVTRVLGEKGMRLEDIFFDKF